jgi:hypothetical protein
MHELSEIGSRGRMSLAPVARICLRGPAGGRQPGATGNGGDTLMKNKPYIYTLVLQEEKIKELTKRNKQLERGYLSVTRVNDRLRRQIARLKRRENELDNVNI